MLLFISLLNFLNLNNPHGFKNTDIHINVQNLY